MTIPREIYKQNMYAHLHRLGYDDVLNDHPTRDTYRKLEPYIQGIEAGVIAERYGVSLYIHKK